VPSKSTKRVRAKTVRKAVAADTAAVAAVAVAIAAAAEAVAAVVVTVAAAVVAVDTATEAATEAATKPEHAINSQRGVRKGALFVALSNADRARPGTIERKRVSRRTVAKRRWPLGKQRDPPLTHGHFAQCSCFDRDPMLPGGTSTPSLSHLPTSHRVLLGAQFDFLPKVEL
jgi:hypothetical protein